jgi:hypothetical protein
MRVTRKIFEVRYGYVTVGESLVDVRNLTSSFWNQRG